MCKSCGIISTTREGVCVLSVYFLRSPSRVPYRTELLPRAPKGRRTRTPHCRAFLNITNHFIFFFSQPCFGTEKWWRYRRDFGEGICMRIVSCNCFPHTHTKGPGAARGGLLCRVVITSRRHQPHNAASNWYHRRCGRRSKHGLPASSLSNQQLRC